MTRLKSLFLISICVLLYAIYYWIVPLVVDIQGKVPIIKNVVHKELGADIELDKPKLKMGLTPSVWLEAKYFSIDDKNSTPFALSNPRLKIKLLPLLFGKIELGYFSCDNINADLKIDKKNRLYIGNYLILKNSNPRISLEDAKMEIGNYHIKLNDELRNNKVFLSGDYFDLNRFNSKKYLKFSTNSKLTVNNRTSVINIDVDFKLPFKKSFESNDIVFDGTITNLNLSDLSSYIKLISKNKIKRTSGLVNIEADTKVINHNIKRIQTQIAAENIAIIGKNNDSIIAFKDKLNVISICDFSKNMLNIKKFNVFAKNLNLSISGRISQMSSKNPNLNLTVKAEKSRFENITPFLPANNALDNGLNLVALKKYGLYSDVEGNLLIKGKADKPVLIGEFISRNSYVVKPLPSNIPKATVKIKFLKDKLFLEVIAPASPVEKVVVSGIINLFGDKSAKLKVSSTPNVDLKIIQEILNPVHEIFCFEIGPLPIMKLAGFGNVNFDILGDKKSPSLKGIINFKNATASFNGIDLALKNVDGILYFQDKNTHFITKKAFLNGKPVKVDGTCSLFGVLNFDASSSSQNLNDLINILKNSPMLIDIQKALPVIDAASGKVNIAINLSGRVPSSSEFTLGKTVHLKGKIKLLGNIVAINGLQFPIKNLFGDINFKGMDSDLNLYSFADQSKIYLKGKIAKNNAQLDIKGSLKNNPFNFSGSVKNIFQKNQIINAKLTSDNFDVSALKNAAKYPFITPEIQKYIAEITNPTGHINIRATIKNNVINSKVKLSDVGFRYSKFNIPVKIMSGNVEINNNKLILYKVNAIIDSMPILIDGLITDIFKTPKFNIYINSKPSQKFIEKYINKNSVYPLKIKGDIIYSARINGTKNMFSAKTEINLQENSSIYYMGSTLGDANDPIRIFLDTYVTKNSIYVGNFQYDKLISSQNDKEFISPQLNAKGQIYFDKNNITFNNFRVKTSTPTDAKIFNILFKKPMIKQGLFTANILMNSSITSPKMIGTLNFNGIDIPLLDTTIKDISLDFDKNNVDIKTKGEIFENKIIVFATMQNKMVAPFVFDNIDVYLGNLDVNQIVKRLNKLEIETEMHKLGDSKENVDISGIIIKNGKLKADSIFVKNLFAKDLTADFSLNEKLILALNDFKFDIAEGTVNGNLKYNLLNSNSNLELHVDNVNANTMAEALFDLPNQIFGELTGQVDLKCNGKTHKTCMDTLSGTGGFRVANGRMPKLGSLEYLLKAANLAKSGITGITINSIVELVSPLKTGQFENINGSFNIISGLADSIQIFSKGKDLSVFLTGTYNFTTLVADMEVFGRISKKITNVLGPIGNTSLNTLFNTIPGLNLDAANNAEFLKKLNKIPGFELSDKLYRIFSAKIYGDINGENYVESFKWVE